MRGAGFRLAGLRVVVRGEHVDRGLVRAQRRLGGQRGSHRVIEPGLLQLPVQPGAALSTNPAETGMPSSMPIRCAARSAGTFP